MEKVRPVDVAALAALDEPVRCRLYEYVRDRGAPVTREAAAAAAGTSINLAAFHLDKLVALGLLAAHYGRPPDAPPQRGRSPKLYRVSDAEFSISVPARRYDLSGEILLDALETRQAGETSQTAVQRAAHNRGKQVGYRVKTQKRLRRLPRAQIVDVAQQLLEEHGYEPYVDQDSTLRLRNCPFNQLAQQSRELVCSMNRAFIDGLLRGLGDDLSEAALVPREGECCVAISAARETA